MALTRLDLDALVAKGCGVPGCDHKGHDEPMYLHAACHERANLVVSYRVQTGCLALRCGRCGDFVAEVVVACAPPAPTAGGGEES